MCYQCSQCNRCGRFSYRTTLRCKTCGAPVPSGSKRCSQCHTETNGNLEAGPMEFDPNAFVREDRRSD